MSSQDLQDLQDLQDAGRGRREHRRPEPGSGPPLRPREPFATDEVVFDEAEKRCIHIIYVTEVVIILQVLVWFPPLELCPLFSDEPVKKPLG